MLTNDPTEFEDAEKYLHQLTLRQYQTELIKTSKSQNSIIFLPTGCGKTLIALHVLRSRMKDLTMPAKALQKVAVFLATTKVLVNQLASVVSENTDLKCKTFFGEMGVDDWTVHTWHREIGDNQVFFMVPAIFLIIIQRKILSLDKVSLIVFDECHHAVLGHPYRRIMQEFEYVPEGKRPLVLGLTATALNSNPKNNGLHEVQVLKETFHGSFAKTDSLEEAMRYGTSAKELFITYDSTVMTNAASLVLNLIKKSCNSLEFLKIVGVLEARAIKVMPKGGVLLAKTNSLVKEIGNMLKHVERAVKDLGLYPTSIVALYYYIRFERLKLLKESSAEITVIKYALTVLNTIRRIIFRYIPMNDENKVTKFSSKKVNALIDFIKSYEEHDNVRCIIMVEERITAVVMAEMFNELGRTKNKFYKADFITGGLFSSVFDHEETKFEQKRFKRVIRSDNDFHFLFATDVVEEGVDIPSCQLVIKFDSPKDYRSYIQSKGRARFKDSKYVVFCKNEDMREVEKKIQEFNTTQKNLMRVLTAESLASTVKEESEEKEEEEEEEEEEMFFVKGPDGPHISGTKAISFIMRYCTRLPQDKYSLLAPICWYDRLTKKAFLRLPAGSPLRKTIEGDPRNNRKLAKKNVFLKTVEELYKIGEVLEDLTLRSYTCKEEDHKDLFPNFLKLPSDKRNVVDVSGTRKKYEVEYSENLSHCLPQPNLESYIHVIKVTPQFERPDDSRTRVCYDMLCDPNGFAILSSRRLPEICEFPLFLSMGEFKCSLVVNVATVVLNDSDLEKLKKFHFFIFNTLLCVVNRLQVFDNTGKNHSFFIIPIKYVEYKPVINWDVINDRVALTECAELSELISQNSTLDDYLYSVVYPKYRQIASTNKYYIVTALDHSKTPMSTFPSEDFKNYFHYFLNKYQVRITNKEQSLIEVKHIPERINYLRPRSTLVSRSKRKCEENNENFKEHLVPELCERIQFPGFLWLKATILPSALHRIMTISHIDDMRKIIASQTKLGISDLGCNFSWLPLQVENYITAEEETSSQFEWPCNTKQRLMTSQDENPELQDPLDLFRHMNECAPCDMIHYVNHFGLGPNGDNSMLSLRKEQEDLQNRIFADLSATKVPDLPVSLENHNQKGPELRDFIKVFTGRSANDIVDLEKLEFLGDSFLKFAAALYGFKTCDGNEGKLVSMKDRIVCNRNLYACGIEKRFQGVLLTSEFHPRSGWSPPLFSLPPEINNLTDQDPFEIEYSFEIPVKDKLSGKLSPKVVKAIQDFMAMEDRKSVYTPDEAILCFKTIKDKCIADCVEALIGLYVKECGLVGGFKILNWLQILPEKNGSYNDLMKKTYSVQEDKSANIIETLVEYSYKELEKTLGYQFKNKALLLEAMTHPSVFDSPVCNYQRLEFLGDAVMDFIMSLYIHHSCPDLPPGDTTDIRMSLVNNVTMACIAVKYNFHKYLINQSSPLFSAINQFVSFQKERNHKVDDAVLILNEEGEQKLAEAIEVPKALGDLFESLAGAIFLDSGNCLKTVWKSYYPLMKDTIETSLKNPAKSPIRKIFEYCKPPPTFEFETKNNGLIVAICKIIHNEKEKFFYGKATSMYYSKLSAAKLALRFLEGLVDDE